MGPSSSEQVSSRRYSRRQWLKHSALAGSVAVGLGAWPRRSLARRVSPNEKLNIASIGVGGKGVADTRGVSSENMVAICDVDERMLDRAAKRFPKAKRYNDFRKMLAREKLDAVTVTTPDHTHTVASVAAMKRGLHVYCQKPLTRCIEEVRVMRRVAKETGVCTQMGNQGHAEDGLRRCVELLQADAIGPVREVHVWTDRPSRFWKNGLDKPTETPPVPEYMTWDLWLGPAGKHAYHAVYHPDGWRGFVDFGTGALGDMGCHIVDTAFWGLELGMPTSVEAKTSGFNGYGFPLWSIVRYAFPARGKRPPVKLTWYDGGKQPPERFGKMPSNGSIFVGSEGIMRIDGSWGEPKLEPAEKFADFKGPEPTIPRSPGHYKEWIAACKGGPASLSNFDYATRLTEMILLGNLAVCLGRKIRWDAKAMRCPDCPEADALIRTSYRKGWEI